MHTGSVPQRRGSATTYGMPNWRGDAARQTNATGGTTAYRAYDAFGVRTINNLTPVGPFGYAASSGYQGDEDSGLMLLGHRYYDPSTGRFLTRDSAKDGRNWYAYCGNNPLRSVDPSGLDVGDDWPRGIPFHPPAEPPIRLDPVPRYGVPTPGRPKDEYPIKGVPPKDGGPGLFDPGGVDITLKPGDGGVVFPIRFPGEPPIDIQEPKLIIGDPRAPVISYPIRGGPTTILFPIRFPGGGIIGIGPVVGPGGGGVVIGGGVKFPGIRF